MLTAIKAKECAGCGKPFMPRNSFQTVCFKISCTRKMLAKKERAERDKTRMRKEAIKSRSEWAREAQTVVNKYVRLRDKDKPCCSCDKPATWHGQWHASHFRSVGASPATRFNLWNINKACSICNTHLSGNLSEYEPRLRLKIGNERVDFLRSLSHTPRYSIEYLMRVRDVFTKKVKRLERRME